MKDYTGRCIGCDRRCEDADHCSGCGCYVCESCEERPQKRTGTHSPMDHLDTDLIGGVN